MNTTKPPSPRNHTHTVPYARRPSPGPIPTPTSPSSSLSGMEIPIPSFKSFVTQTSRTPSPHTLYPPSPPTLRPSTPILRASPPPQITPSPSPSLNKPLPLSPVRENSWLPSPVSLSSTVPVCENSWLPSPVAPSSVASVGTLIRELQRSSSIYSRHAVSNWEAPAGWDVAGSDGEEERQSGSRQTKSRDKMQSGERGIRDENTGRIEGIREYSPLIPSPIPSPPLPRALTPDLPPTVCAQPERQAPSPRGSPGARAVLVTRQETPSPRFLTPGGWPERKGTGNRKEKPDTTFKLEIPRGEGQLSPPVTPMPWRGGSGSGAGSASSASPPLSRGRTRSRQFGPAGEGPGEKQQRKMGGRSAKATRKSLLGKPAAMERGRWESVDGEWVDEEEDVRGDEKVEMRDMLATGKSYEELVTEYQEASGRHPDQRVEEGEEVGMVPQPLFWQRDSMLSGQLADDEGRKDNGMKGGKKRSFSGGFRKHEKPSAMSMPLKLMLTSGNGRYSPDASFDGKAATSVKSPTRSVRFRDRSTSRKSSKSSKSSKEKKKRTPLMPPLTLHLPKKLVGAAKPAKPVHKDDKTSQKSVSLPRLKHASLGPRLRKTPTIEGRDWSERGYDPRLHPSTMNSNTPTTLSVPPLLSNEPVVFSGLIDRASKIRPVNVKTDSASSGTPSSSFSPVTPVSPRSNRSSLLAQVVEKAWSTSVLGHRRHDRNVSVKSNLSTSINQGSKVEEKMEENRRKRASSLKSMRPAFLSRKLEGRRELERERRREELKKSIRFVGQIDPHARASYVRDEEHGLKAPSSPRSLKSKGWI